MAQLEKYGELVRIAAEVDPYLEMAEIQRQVYRQGGKAVLFENVKGCAFPCVSNLFGTPERARLIFKGTYAVATVVLGAKANPVALLKRPLGMLRTAAALLHGLPLQVPNRSAPVMQRRAKMSDLPQIQSWPDDGGPFATLSQVYSEHPDHCGHPLKSNLGLYRVQLAGNEYIPDREVGIHYQIHRGIGIHQKLHNDRRKPFRVAVFVGGPPAMAFSAVMPLPEGMPEVAFSGLLAGRNFRYTRYKEWTLAADADFAIIGTIMPGLKREGPFGDHLGYYSLDHLFPCMEVEAVFHRRDAIWPFTVVGRPPQEDTTFGKVIHDLTSKVLPAEIPGLEAVHAVDAAGVHPLMLAVGEERYTPYIRTSRPAELLTTANAILGKGQLSLAKYLLIADAADRPNIRDVPAFFQHVLERIDWKRDLHFQTEVSIDTLDYSSTELNVGSKVVWACTGAACRSLALSPPALPGKITGEVAAAGILAVAAPPCIDYTGAPDAIEKLIGHLAPCVPVEDFPLVVVCDDPAFLAADFNNLLWVTFTRSNPSHDIYGIGTTQHFKHWGCSGPLLIDARLKPHSAPPLVENQEVVAKAAETLKRSGLQPLSSSPDVGARSR